MDARDGMVSIGGVRYRIEDAYALGLLDPPSETATGAPEPETTAAPAPDNKNATPKGGRRRPTAKE